MKTHELKTWPQYFSPMVTGAKKFELRKNDRGFQIGDLLILREYSPCQTCNDLRVVNPDGYGLNSAPCPDCGGKGGTYSGRNLKRIGLASSPTNTR